MKDHDYDELVVWQDLLDEVLAGRTQGLRCPVCDAAGIEVEKDPARIFVRCKECGKTFEGRFKV